MKSPFWQGMTLFLLMGGFFGLACLSHDTEIKAGLISSATMIGGIAGRHITADSPIQPAGPAKSNQEQNA